MRVAFAGAGRMARLHLHALRRVRTPHFVAAVCDTTDSAAREVAALAGAVAYTSLAELLREAQPSLVHVCTPAGTHYQPARQALLAGAHVYVEKPFVETQREARELLGLARDRGLLVCAGHQQVRDPAYRKLMARVPALGAVAQVDSHFAFRPVGMNPERAGPKALAAQLLDILPHPLYTLIAALEGTTADSSAIEVAAVVAAPTDLHAVIRANGAFGRLAVSLRARPVASTLSVFASGGMLTADFIRTSVVGAANAGTAPLEKAANPLVEGWQTAARGTAGVMRRILQGGDYPGLAELIGDFYVAVARGGASPLAPDHPPRAAAPSGELGRRLAAAPRVPLLVYVSSLSVLRPPRTPWERQDERTPLAPPDARKFGSYAWGKTEAERVVAAEAASLGIETRVIRPAALVDWTNPEMPGLVGRRLFGSWHLGFGRPGLVFAVCEVGRAAAAVAWCAEQFAEAPAVVNLFDPAISTRRRLLDLIRSHGWRGRMVWLPIPVFALLVTTTRVVLSLVRLRLPSRLAVWSIFRPRRYDPALSTKLLEAAHREPVRAAPPRAAQLLW